MQQTKKSKGPIAKRLTYANVMVTILAFIVLGGGSALAAGLGKNSVGSRQLKSKSVTTGKLANNAVNGAKVANGSLTGADINVGALGVVPNATSAANAGNVDTVGGHSASCPANTTLIRGVCFDSSANGEAPSVTAAADACAAKGGYLPTPLELYSTRGSSTSAPASATTTSSPTPTTPKAAAPATTRLLSTAKGPSNATKSPKPLVIPALIRWYVSDGEASFRKGSSGGICRHCPARSVRRPR